MSLRGHIVVVEADGDRGGGVKGASGEAWLPPRLTAFFRAAVRCLCASLTSSARLDQALKAKNDVKP